MIHWVTATQSALDAMISWGTGLFLRRFLMMIISKISPMAAAKPTAQIIRRSCCLTLPVTLISLTCSGMPKLERGEKTTVKSCSGQSRCELSYWLASATQHFAGSPLAPLLAVWRMRELKCTIHSEAIRIFAF